MSHHSRFHPSSIHPIEERAVAKFIKYKLVWKPSDSDLIVSYKLYWSKKDRVGYDSHFIELGNVNEVYLPDIFKYVPRKSESIRFGISAVNIEGNESDITILSETYRAIAPDAPADCMLTDPDEIKVNVVEANRSKKKPQPETTGMEEPLEGNRPTRARVKYYDDIGYRVLDIEKKTH